MDSVYFGFFESSATPHLCDQVIEFRKNYSIISIIYTHDVRNASY